MKDERTGDEALCLSWTNTANFQDQQFSDDSFQHFDNKKKRSESEQSGPSRQSPSISERETGSALSQTCPGSHEAFCWSELVFTVEAGKQRLVHLRMWQTNNDAKGPSWSRRRKWQRTDKAGFSKPFVHNCKLNLNRQWFQKLMRVKQLKERAPKNKSG